MSLPEMDIGKLVNGSAILASLALLLLCLWRTRKLNFRLVSRYYLSPLLVLFAYFLVFSIFTVIPLLLSFALEPLMIWVSTLSFGSFLTSSADSSFQGSFLIWIGLSECVVGAYWSYRDFLKQA